MGRALGSLVFLESPISRITRITPSLLQILVVWAVWEARLNKGSSEVKDPTGGSRTSGSAATQAHAAGLWNLPKG